MRAFRGTYTILEKQGEAPKLPGKAMNETIRTAYNNCKPEDSLPAGDPRYIDFDKDRLRGTDGDLVRELLDALELDNEPTRLLVSGHWGCGKTTELLRLRKELEDRNYWVVMIDSEAYLNLKVPATISDLWICIAAGFDAFLEVHEALPADVRRLWDRVRAFLERLKATEIGAHVGVDAGVVAGIDVRAALKDAPDLREKLNEAIESRRPELVRECQNFVGEAIALLQKKERRAGTVLILDSFEKLEGTFRNSDDVRRSAEELFDRDWRLLAAPCHAIYTVPLWLAFVEIGAKSELGRTRLLSMCKVAEKSGEPYVKGIEALLDLVGKRMDMQQIFGDRARELLEPLVRASGGYLRDLLRMMRDVLLRNARSEDLPLPPTKVAQDVARVIAVYSEQYKEALGGEHLELLARIALDHDLGGLTKEEKLQIADLFKHHFVQSYRNGERWFDLHPLVAESASVKAAIGRETEARKQPPKVGFRNDG